MQVLTRPLDSVLIQRSDHHDACVIMIVPGAYVPALLTPTGIVAFMGLDDSPYVPSPVPLFASEQTAWEFIDVGVEVYRRLAEDTQAYIERRRVRAEKREEAAEDA